MSSILGPAGDVASDLVRPAGQHGPAPELAIRADNLTKHFGEIHAVNGIALRVPVGQVFGFLGQNGSGKSTTVRMLTTLLKPTDGEAQVAGLDVRREARQVRQSIGVALQDAGPRPDADRARTLASLRSALQRAPRRHRGAHFVPA